MIDFNQGELKDILPVNLKIPETLALSFAVGQAMGQLRDFSKRIYMYADLSRIPEAVLDLMALEFNTQYYDQNLKREVKEGLVAQTLTWYMHAGTPSVLREFLATVLQGGDLQEWYEYDGEPYYFKAIAAVGKDGKVPLGYGAEIRERIGIYKNARSWLESLVFTLHTAFEVPVEYAAWLLLRWEFYARNNRQFLYLDGTWKLDDTYRLNGYRETEAEEFYPVQLEMEDGYQVQAGAEGQLAAVSGCPENVGASSGLRLSGEAKGSQQISGRLQTGSEALLKAGLGSTLRVENDLWYLDDTYLLDGTRYLAAEIFNYEL